MAAADRPGATRRSNIAAADSSSSGGKDTVLGCQPSGLPMLRTGLGVGYPLSSHLLYPCAWLRHHYLLVHECNPPPKPHALCYQSLPHTYSLHPPTHPPLLPCLRSQVPTSSQAAAVTEELRARSNVPLHLRKVLDALPTEAHPMTQLSMGIMALQVGGRGGIDWVDERVGGWALVGGWVGGRGVVDTRMQDTTSWGRALGRS